MAIQYYHPKYSRGAGEYQTNKWDSWVRVTVYSGLYPNTDPDGIWRAHGGLTHSNGIVSVPSGAIDSRVRTVIAHEVGHVTKQQFKRQDFGPQMDHSLGPGLMDRSASIREFTERELNILRGISQ